MANPDHWELFMRGTDAWYRWREENPKFRPDLSEADFREASSRGFDLRMINLRDANLRGADFHGIELAAANFHGSDCTGTNFGGAGLSGTHFPRAILHGAELHSSNLNQADLRRANITNAQLAETTLREADLREANLGGAFLGMANFEGADLRGADLSAAHVWRTIFANTNLTGTQIEHCQHDGPSTIDSRTLQQSWPISDAFLRGCGLSDWEIEAANLYDSSLPREAVSDIQYRVFDLRAGKPLQIHNLFISYSHADGAFVDHVELHLTEKGIRFWRDIHHAMSGRLERVIDRAMRLNPTVLLILSRHSVASDWVEHEVRLARQLEKETGRDVLCPIALDDAWKNCRWPARLREQIEEYNILDLSCWRDKEAFRRVFNRLVEGLNLFYASEV